MLRQLGKSHKCIVSCLAQSGSPLTGYPLTYLTTCTHWAYTRPIHIITSLATALRTLARRHLIAHVATTPPSLGSAGHHHSSRHNTPPLGSAGIVEVSTSLSHRQGRRSRLSSSSSARHRQGRHSRLSSSSYIIIWRPGARRCRSFIIIPVKPRPWSSLRLVSRQWRRLPVSRKTGEQAHINLHLIEIDPG